MVALYQFESCQAGNCIAPCNWKVSINSGEAIAPWPTLFLWLNGGASGGLLHAGVQVLSQIPKNFGVKLFPWQFISKCLEQQNTCSTAKPNEQAAE